jgi:hypothetical protein
MEQAVLKEIIERTFANLCCPLESNGVYNEIKKAILEAYSVGRFQQDEHEPAITSLPIGEPR